MDDRRSRRKNEMRHFVIYSESQFDKIGLQNLIRKIIPSEDTIEAHDFKDKYRFMRDLAFRCKVKTQEYPHGGQISLHIFAIRDSDGENIDGLKNRIIASFKDKQISEEDIRAIHIHFAVQEIEAWILADKDFHSNPESVTDAKGELKKHLKNYQASHIVDLLPAIDVSKVKSKCPHFGKFYDDVHVILNQDQ
jgi:hypothetical protein